MKTLKASNLNQAVKELNKIDKSLIEKVDENVKDANKAHYHVILVKVKDRPGQAKNKVTVIVQTYNKAGFEKIKKNFVFQGFSSVVLLHDPSTLSAEELAPTKKLAEKPAPVAPVDTKKDETISAQANTISEKDQEIADLKAKLSEKPAPVDNGDVDFDVETADFKSLNEFAAANKIELGTAKSTDAIRVVVKEWIAKKVTTK